MAPLGFQFKASAAGWGSKMRQTFGVNTKTPVRAGATVPSGIKMVGDRDGTCHFGFAAQDISLLAFGLLDFLAHEAILLHSFHFGLVLTDDSWVHADESIVAAELVPDELVKLSPNNTFDPAFPGPCLGVVPASLPLLITEAPKGHVVGGKDEVIFSARMRRFLERYGSGTTGEVILNGKPLSNWFRYFPEEKQAVLSTQGLFARTCNACGTTVVRNSGVWLGTKRDDFSVCQDVIGMSHLGLSHPYVVSVPVAQEMERTIGTGYGLFPIVDTESDFGQRIIAIIQRIKDLRLMPESQHRID
jgi:hypothetical protein